MLNKIKSLFIVEDENAQSVQNSGSSSAGKQTQTTKNVDPNNNVKSTPPAEGKPEERFLTMLWEVLAKNDLEGFDYLEFREALKNLDNMAMDEATRYKSAMAMAKTMKASKQVLLQSANHYLKKTE